MKKDIGKKAIVASVFLAMLLLFSAAGLTTLAADTESATLLIEVENNEQLQGLRDNGMILVDYDNGMALIEVPKAQLNAYRDAYNTRMDDNRYEINLWNSGHKVDRRQGMPEIPTELRTDDLSGVKPYVVQFIGPMPSSEWKDMVIDAGADIQGDLGNYAVLARMDPSTRTLVEKLDVVAFVGVYHPAYKIQQGLLEKEGSMEVKVYSWNDIGLTALSIQLDEMGATVGKIHEFGVIATIDAELLPAIAALDDVYSIYGYARRQTLDNMANQIHEVQSLWYTSWSGLPQRITGSTQIIGMQDTGFDIGNPDAGHPDFFRGPLGDRIVRYTDRTGSSDPDGTSSTVAHGTHCAGIVMGNGWSWRTHIGAPTPDVDTSYHLGEATGAAPESRMSIDGVTDARSGGLSADITYMNDQEADGARTFTNSWGMGGAYGYDGTSTDLDNMLDGGMTHAYENVILFAAGNDGPDEGTVGREANAKNVISVGASENYRPEWHSAENPGNVADFSGRGGNIAGGRIAPDIVAVGTAQISAFGIGEWDYYESSGQGVPQPGWFQDVDEYDYTIPGPGSDGRADYQYMQGTSMACPQAAGMVALTREYYTLLHGNELATIDIPSNSLVRASLINGADRMNPMFDYPGYDQGWGRLNLKNSLYPDAPQSNQFAEGTFSATGTMDLATDLGFNLNVNSGDVPLKATLVWVDSSGETLNRQLHLSATSPSSQAYRSGVGNYDANGWTIPGANNADTTNYVQRIEIEEPEAGLWSFTVHGDSIPSAANFAIVMSADFGPQNTYDVDLQTDYPTTMSLVAGGQTNLPITVRNWGTTADTISLSDTSPGGIAVSYSPSSSLSLASEAMQNVDVILGADAGLAADVYKFEITGTSGGDASVQDTLRLTVQVLADKLPYKDIAAGEAEDERWADVITFTDAGGIDRIFISYMKDTLDGDRIFVKHSELGADGKPISWSTPIMVDTGAGQLDYPGWAQLLHVRGGTYQDRVMVYWSGSDPVDTDKTPAYVCFADNTNYNSWSTPVEIDYNYGGDVNNVKRALYMLWRDDGSQYGELTFVFEHLDNGGEPDYAISGIGIAYTISTDGGLTWSARTDVPGAAPGGTYYYFFPSGVTDQNEVNWHFFYYREASGNTRIVVTMLQEGTTWSGETIVMGDFAMDSHNWQFPSATHANVGGTNTIYVSAVYDNGGTHQDVSTGYIEGNYYPGSPPADNSFNAQDAVFGSQVVEAGYMESYVLSTATTGDGWAWTGYQETGTSFDVPNIDAGRTNDNYVTKTVDYVTRDNYAKLNPQMSSLTIGGTSYLYVSYHASYGTVTDVDYQIYLSIFNSGFATEADTVGPMASQVSANPNPIDLALDTTIDITATIDDTQTGFSGIADAQYLITDSSVTDPLSVSWPGTFMTVSGTSQIETASAINVDVSGLADGTYHVWVRGQDEFGNWGDEYADYGELVVDTSGPVTTPPSISLTSPIGGEAWEVGTNHDITWTTTAGDGTITGVDLEYSTDAGVSWTTIVTGTADDGSYTWTVPNEPTTEARVRATVHDDLGSQGTDTSANFEIAAEVFVPPTITLTSPIGAESWDAGTNHDITWSTTAGDGTITGVDLEYSTDAGVSWTAIVTGTADDGSYTWTVPDVHTSEAQVRATVHDTNAMTGTDTSGNFNIVGVPPTAPLDLDVIHTGATGSSTTEIRYMRADNVLGTTQSATNQAGADLGNNADVYAGIRAWVVDDLGTETELTSGSAVGIASVLGNNNPGAMVAGATWTAPETALETTDSIRVRLYQGITSPPASLIGTFTTEELGATQLDAVAWQPHYFIVSSRGNQLGSWVGWGSDTRNTRIENFQHSVTGGDGTEDNLVTWNASADEPAKVTGYNIYRSDSSTGPWTLIDTVTADGGPYSYVDSGAGTNDTTLWWYTVYSDQDGYEGDGVGPVQEPGETLDTFSIDLFAGGDAAGWNFVSFNLTLADTSLTAILDDATYGVSGNYDKVMYHSRRIGDERLSKWLSYVPGRATHYNNLDTWNHTMGLWIHMTTSDTLTVEGTAPVSTDITLYPGWNMVGLPSSTVGNHGLPTQVSKIGYFQATATYNMAYNYDPATFNFQPGQGYMVYLDNADPVIWNVDY